MPTNIVFNFHNSSPEMNGSEEQVLWKAENFCQPPPQLAFAVIVLNESIDSSDFQFVYHLWQKGKKLFKNILFS